MYIDLTKLKEGDKILFYSLNELKEKYRVSESYTVYYKNHSITLNDRDLKILGTIVTFKKVSSIKNQTFDVKETGYWYPVEFIKSYVGQKQNNLEW